MLKLFAYQLAHATVLNKCTRISHLDLTDDGSYDESSGDESSDTSKDSNGETSALQGTEIPSFPMEEAGDK